MDLRSQQFTPRSVAERGVFYAMIQPNDPLDLVAGVLANLYVRFVLLAATIFFGLVLAGFAADYHLIPSAIIAWSGLGALMATGLVTIATVVTLTVTDSTRIACLTLALNCLAWSWAGVTLIGLRY